MSILQLKDGRWIVEYKKGKNPDDPNRTREYFGRGVQAEQKARVRDEALHPKSYRAAGPHLESPTFGKLAVAYLKSRESKNERTTHAARYPKFKSIILPNLGATPVRELTKERLDLYVKMRLATPKTVLKGRAGRQTREPILDESGAPRLIKRTTVHREISDIQAVLNWAVRRELIDRNPLVGYEKPKRDDAPLQPPSLDEARRLIQCAAPHLRRALVISLYTGLRPGYSELLRLTWNDVDLEAGTILVRSAMKGGSCSRLIPLHADLFERLKQWRADDRIAGKTAPEIITYRGRPIKRLKSAWRNAKRRAGISRRLRLYDFRHYFATAALAGGSDLKSTSEILGHTRTDTTTRVYQHVAMDDYRRTIDSLPSIEIEEKRDNVIAFPVKNRA